MMFSGVVDSSFYSILVRLKVRSSAHGSEKKTRFYSILVRLKGILIPLAMTDYIEFLFHTGSIKRLQIQINPYS